MTVALTVRKSLRSGDTVILSDLKVRQAKPREKPYKLHDERGMYLLVNPAGRYWRMDYRFEGKRKTMALGVYPEVGLGEARDKRDTARQALRMDRDPMARTAASTVATFGAAAQVWFAKRSPGWAVTHRSKISIRLDNDLLSWLGNRPLAELSAPEILKALERVEKRGAVDTAHRCQQYVAAIFDYAITAGLTLHNPARGLSKALQTVQGGHYATITDPAQIGALLRSLDGYSGDFVTRCALAIAPLTFVRPGELRAAEWAEFDLDAAEWRIPGEKMKMGDLHIVPLSRQALAVLTELHPLTGHRRYVFNLRDRPMSDNTVRSAIRRLGYSSREMTGHGFRAMASTLLHEQGWMHDAIERQLAHAPRNKVSAAYNYAQHLPERRKMMQAWADYLDSLRETLHRCHLA